MSRSARVAALRTGDSAKYGGHLLSDVSVSVQCTLWEMGHEKIRFNRRVGKAQPQNGLRPDQNTFWVFGDTGQKRSLFGIAVHRSMVRDYRRSSVVKTPKNFEMIVGCGTSDARIMLPLSSSATFSLGLTPYGLCRRFHLFLPVRPIFQVRFTVASLSQKKPGHVLLDTQCEPGVNQMGGMNGVRYKTTEIWPMQICGTQRPPKMRWFGLTQADEFLLSTAPVPIGPKTVACITIDQLENVDAPDRILQRLKQLLTGGRNLRITTFMLF